MAGADIQMHTDLFENCIFSFETAPKGITPKINAFYHVQDVRDSVITNLQDTVNEPIHLIETLLLFA